MVWVYSAVLVPLPDEELGLVGKCRDVVSESPTWAVVCFAATVMMRRRGSFPLEQETGGGHETIPSSVSRRRYP